MIFVDTSAWVALEDKTDANHESALNFKEILLSSKSRLVTTNYVLDETYTLLLLDIGYNRTVLFKHRLDDLIHSGVLIIFHITPGVEIEAWNIFEHFNKDKTWSFTDCTSKVIMESIGIIEAFTFDRHFEQMGMLKRP
jgi:predicted nucleic acid-binding protein